jgi:hypothetical protein
MYDWKSQVGFWAAILGFEFSSLHFLGKDFTTWVTFSVSFCFILFSIGSCTFALARLRLQSSYLCLLLRGITWGSHHTWSSTGSLMFSSNCIKPPMSIYHWFSFKHSSIFTHLSSTSLLSLLFSGFFALPQ